MTDVNAINGYAASIANTSSTANASKTLAADMNTFLKLLTTQLQYQDPLNPTDASEFTNQLVQYSSVEQAIQTNQKLEQLLALNINNLGAQAVSYIGKTAQVLGDVMPLQDGAAKATYTLDKDVESCVIMVKDSTGKVVYTETGNKVAGTHTFNWDGKDNDGNQLEDGAYQIVVSATAPAGEAPATVITTIFGKVTGVASDSSGVYIGLGDSVTASLGDILTVRDSDFLTKGSSTAGADKDKDDSTTEANGGKSDSDGNQEEISTVSLIGELIDTVKDAAEAAALIL